jgi:hypothetical protein
LLHLVDQQTFLRLSSRFQIHATQYEFLTTGLEAHFDALAGLFGDDLFVGDAAA